MSAVTPCLVTRCRNFFPCWFLGELTVSLSSAFAPPSSPAILCFLSARRLLVYIAYRGYPKRHSSSPSHSPPARPTAPLPSFPHAFLCPAPSCTRVHAAYPCQPVRVLPHHLCPDLPHSSVTRLLRRPCLFLRPASSCTCACACQPSDPCLGSPSTPPESSSAPRPHQKR